MNSSELAGITVLVTRPRELAGPLCAAVEHHGGVAIRWPGLEIESRVPDADAVAKLRRAVADDVVIFVSRNAVTHGVDLLHHPVKPRLAAIGARIWLQTGVTTIRHAGSPGTTRSTRRSAGTGSRLVAGLALAGHVIDDGDNYNASTGQVGIGHGDV